MRMTSEKRQNIGQIAAKRRIALLKISEMFSNFNKGRLIRKGRE